MPSILSFYELFELNSVFFLVSFILLLIRTIINSHYFSFHFIDRFLIIWRWGFVIFQIWLWRSSWPSQRLVVHDLWLLNYLGCLRSHSKRRTVSLFTFLHLIDRFSKLLDLVQSSLSLVIVSYTLLHPISCRIVMIFLIKVLSI